MSRKDFKLIAEMLESVATRIPATRYREVCERFADRLANTNPRFNRTRFLEACGVEVR